MESVLLIRAMFRRRMCLEDPERVNWDIGVV